LGEKFISKGSYRLAELAKGLNNRRMQPSFS
jgi:hypothetical protein